MNTPEPCCRCNNCHFDPMQEDNPAASAYCISKDKTKWGDKNCPCYRPITKYGEELYGEIFKKGDLKVYRYPEGYQVKISSDGVNFSIGLCEGDIKELIRKLSLTLPT